MTRRGATEEFIDRSLMIETDECIYWPYAKSGGGSAMIRRNGEKIMVTRAICEKVYGSPPDVTYQAAHSCGNGHLACINWKHLSWKTRSDNTIDQILHETFVNKLTIQDILEIRELSKIMTQERIAKRFNVWQKTISDIVTLKTWNWIKQDGTIDEEKQRSMELRENIVDARVKLAWENKPSLF